MVTPPGPPGPPTPPDPGGAPDPASVAILANCGPAGGEYLLTWAEVGTMLGVLAQANDQAEQALFVASQVSAVAAQNDAKPPPPPQAPPPVPVPFSPIPPPGPGADGPPGPPAPGTPNTPAPHGPGPAKGK